MKKLPNRGEAAALSLLLFCSLIWVGVIYVASPGTYSLSPTFQALSFFITEEQIGAAMFIVGSIGTGSVLGSMSRTRIVSLAVAAGMYMFLGVAYSLASPWSISTLSILFGLSAVWAAIRSSKELF